jgi:RHH-type rel operon transcriptional repressor/antitoxin RelB
MGDPTTLTVSIPREVAVRLDKLTEGTAETRSSLALHALIAYLEQEEWKRAAILEGMRQLDAGRSIPHDEVDKWIASWGSDRELSPPECE